VVRIETRILSPTAINTYLSCPRKFYLRYIRRLRSRPSIYLIRGQIVHKTLHEFHKNHPRISPQTPLQEIRKRLLGIFTRRWENAKDSLEALDLSEKRLEFFRDDSELMIYNFSHWLCKNDMAPAHLTEAKILSHDLGLMGVIDAVLILDDKVILVDYKTSSSDKITDDIQRQAALYALLYEDRYKTTPESVWIHFLNSPGEPKPIHIDDELLQYGRLCIESVRSKTASLDEKDYPCRCGGYCEQDFTKG
jgi:RecB family exonuclease